MFCVLLTKSIQRIFSFFGAKDAFAVFIPQLVPFISCFLGMHNHSSITCRRSFHSHRQAVGRANDVKIRTGPATHRQGKVRHIELLDERANR